MKWFKRLFSGESRRPARLARQSESVLSNLESDSMSTRETAARDLLALPSLGPGAKADARGPLAEILSQTNLDVGLIIGPNTERAVELLTDELEFGWGHRKCSAAKALGRIGDRRAVGPLLDALLIPDASAIRETVAIALSELGQPQWQDCIKPHSAECIAWVCDLCRLVAVGHPRAFDEIIAQAKNMTDYGNSHAICALGLIGGPRSVAALRSILEHYARRPRSLGTSKHVRAKLAARVLAEVDRQAAASWLAGLMAAEESDTEVMAILGDCQEQIETPEDGAWPESADTCIYPEVREAALLARAAISPGP